MIESQKSEQAAAVKNTERIVELISKSKDNLEANIEFERLNTQSHDRDKIFLAILLLIWLAIILYTNFFGGADDPASANANV